MTAPSVHIGQKPAEVSCRRCDVVRPDWQPGYAGVEVHVEAAPAGRLKVTLADLVSLGVCADLPAARRAVAALDPFDYVVTADIRGLDERARFEIVWTPVTGIINLMLDWDLPVFDIALAELAAWLGISHTVTRRALARLSGIAGVEVSALGAPSWHEVRVVLDVDRCPLTSSVPCSVA